MTDPTPLGKLLPIDEAALSFAKRWGLIDDQGQLWCSKRCGRAGRLPSLCCSVCLAAHQAGQRVPSVQGREP
jgi:hypothetical protein